MPTPITDEAFEFLLARAGLTPTDASTIARATAILAAAAALAACFPARRAARIDPNVALRCE